MDQCADEGMTAIAIARTSKPLGIMALADTLKEDARVAVAILKKLKIDVVMLTGDNE